MWLQLHVEEFVGRDLHEAGSFDATVKVVDDQLGGWVGCGQGREMLDCVLQQVVRVKHDVAVSTRPGAVLHLDCPIEPTHPMSVGVEIPLG